MKEKNLYQMGNDIYRGRIDEIVDELSKTSDEWKALNLVEELEQTKLKMLQNERRHSIFFENKSIFELKSGGD